MTLHRYAAKRDKNEKQIAEALRAIGVLVWFLSAEGLPDLLTFYRGEWLPIEVKHLRPRRSATDHKGRSLTGAQCVTWAATKFPIVANIDEALALFGKQRMRKLVARRGRSSRSADG